MNPLTSSSVMAALRWSTLDHMEETGPEEPEVKSRTRYKGVWEEKAIGTSAMKKFRCASESFSQRSFELSMTVIWNMSKKRRSICSYKSLQYCQNTKIVDTTYSSLRLYSKVRKTKMKYYENGMKTVEWSVWNTDYSLLKTGCLTLYAASKCTSIWNTASCVKLQM